MSEHHGDGVTRREVLIGAAGGLALAAVDLPERWRKTRRELKSPASCSRTRTARASSASNPGLAGVLVSNGRDVAVTGPDGRYTLPLPEEATIFVIKPAGFMPPIEPLTNLPRFYRHHQPKGSPAELNLRFEGLPPTGPLPASVDFPLRRQDEPKAFNVVMVTDPQPETGAEVDFIREDLIQALGRRRREASASPRATSCSTISRSIRVRTRSWARSGCRGGTSAAITISISKRPTANIAARRSSAFLARITTRSSTRRRSFSCSMTSTILGPTRTSPGEGASTRAGSTRANSSSCATCSRIRRTTR